MSADGAGDLEDICGTDATDDVMGVHGGQGETEQWPAALRIGALAG